MQINMTPHVFLFGPETGSWKNWFQRSHRRLKKSCRIQKMNLRIVSSFYLPLERRNSATWLWRTRTNTVPYKWHSKEGNDGYPRAAAVYLGGSEESYVNSNWTDTAEFVTIVLSVMCVAFRLFCHHHAHQPGQSGKHCIRGWGGGGGVGHS